MKTYEIFAANSNGFKPGHIFHANSLAIVNGCYVFYDEGMNILHAIAIQPGLFVRTVEK